VFIEAKDDGGGGNWTTGAISRHLLLLLSPKADTHLPSHER